MDRPVEPEVTKTEDDEEEPEEVQFKREMLKSAQRVDGFSKAII